MSAEWHEANQRHLTAELARVRRAVERHVKGDGPAEAEPSALDTELAPPPAATSASNAAPEAPKPRNT